jgi:hypothetical protein
LTTENSKKRFTGQKQYNRFQRIEEEVEWFADNPAQRHDKSKMGRRVKIAASDFRRGNRERNDKECDLLREFFQHNFIVQDIRAAYNARSDGNTNT